MVNGTVWSNNILIDYGAMAHLCGYHDREKFQSVHRSWIDASLSRDQIKRDESWTQSIAIGHRSSTNGRKIRELAVRFELREPEPGYNAFFEGKIKTAFFGAYNYQYD